MKSERCRAGRPERYKKPPLDAGQRFPQAPSSQQCSTISTSCFSFPSPSLPRLASPAPALAAGRVSSPPL